MKKQLSSVAQIQTGPFGSQLHKEDYVDKGTPIVTVEHLGHRVFTEQNLPNVSDVDKQRLAKYILNEGDIVFSRVGSVDRCSYVDKEHDGWMFSGRCLRVRPNKDIFPLYLYYYFCLEETKQFVRNIAVGATMPSINTKIMGEIPVVIPDYNTQKRIALLLSELDNIIENNERINDNLHQQAQTILTSFFIDFSRFGGAVPDDWEQGTLQDIADFLNGYAFKSKELLNAPEPNCYHVFKQGHINRGGGFNSSGTKSWYPISKSSALSKYILHKGDVLMAMTDMKDNVAILGNTALMTVDDQYIVNQRVGLLRSNGYKSTSYAYIYLLTNSFDFLKDLRSRANSGVQVNLSSSEIKASSVWIATDEVNKEFNALTEPLLSMIMANDIENQKLEDLRDTLLLQLISGELDVSNLDL